MIWGVDLGTRQIALFGVDGGLAAAILLRSEAQTRGNAMTDLAIQMERALRHDEQPVLYVEEPPKVKNLRTFLHLGQTCGMVLSYWAPSYEVPVASWKKATVGSGNASKGDVSDWLRDNHPDRHALCRGSQDLIDAACLQIYGTQVDERGRSFALGGSG